MALQLVDFGLCSLAKYCKYMHFKTFLCFHVFFQVLDLLWSLSHLPSLTTEMVDQALRSHNDILSDSYAVKEQIKKNYAVKCMEDIRKGVLIVPAIRQLLLITKGMVKQQFNKHDKVWHNKFFYS